MNISPGFLRLAGAVTLALPFGASACSGSGVGLDGDAVAEQG